MKHYKYSDGFKTRIENANGKWLETVINVPFVGRVGGGIDFTNEQFGIEMKNRMKKYNHSWACNEDDRKRFEGLHHGKDMYWAFVLYELSRDVKDLRRIKNLEPFIDFREVWFLNWDFILQFPVSYPSSSGPFRYPKEINFPAESNFEVKRGERYRILTPIGSQLNQKIK
ncbi:MAG: hypothetical protein WCI72_03295 [archaeon]